MKKLIAANKWWLLWAAWMYTLTFVFNHYWSKFSSYNAVANSVTERIDKQIRRFHLLSNDTATVRKLARFQLDSVPFSSNDLNVYYYIYANTPKGRVLQYWSNAAIIPALKDLPYHNGLKPVTYTNGFYILDSEDFLDSHYTIVQLILVRQEYYVQNNSLKTSFAGFPDLEKHVAYSSTITPYPINLIGYREPIFYLRPIGEGPFVVFNWASLTVQVIAIILFMIFFYRIGFGLARTGRMVPAIIWMLTAGLLIRISIDYIGFPVNVSHLDLFKKNGNGSSWFFPSQGGLLLNLTGTLWLTFFFLRTRSSWLPILKTLNITVRKTIAVVSILSLLPVTFFLSTLIIHIVLQPDVSFDVANFFSLGWNTVGSIVCLYFICVLHYRILYLGNEIFTRLWPANKALKYMVVCASGLLVLTLFIHVIKAQILVLALLWLLTTVLLEDILPRLLFYSMERVVRFVFWLIWYAFAGTLLVQSQYETKEQSRKLQMAESMAQHADIKAESRIYQAMNNADFLKVKEKPLLAKDASYNNNLKQNISHLFSYMLPEYISTTYFFDSTGKALFNSDSTTYETLNTIVEQQGDATQFDNIYFYEINFDRFSYIVRQPLRQDSLNGGYVFVTCTPASFKSEALEPELFKPLQGNQDNPILYNYAIYDYGNLVNSTHNFPFTTVLPPGIKMQSDYEIKTMYGKEALWYNAGNQRIIIIVKSVGLFSEIINLFAYIFGCFIILYIIELFLARLLTGVYSLGPWWKIPQLSIRSKIRRTVILISLFSFILIGATTVYFFVNRYQSANDKRLTQLITQVENDLQTLADIEYLFKQSDSAGGQNDYISNSATVRLVATLLNTDINLFDLQGDLTATSQSIIYERGIISTKMNPAAYYKMAIQQQVQYLQNEKIGTLDYQGVYLPVRSGNHAIGFINIPYFASQVELNQEISNFLVTLLNLIAFIFIISGIVAFFITNNLTSSFFIIGEKMNAISLGTTNEPIIWNRKDEIGVLVRQYNKMLGQLDESARRLATSERESAWREMAKQVAHEIKNPLTPMKLNLQYLQRQIERNSPNVLEMTKSMAINLVTQIDHLNQIASDFSQFARINISRTETFDLHEVLEQIIMLYQMDSSLRITWDKLETPVMISADRTHISRLFTNLLKNATEAVEDVKPEIILTEQAEISFYSIAVSDNGPGIPNDMKHQLFEPSFTTKSSGTGLGLAICKDIAESAGGSIWFQSGNGERTTFFVRLPIADA